MLCDNVNLNKIKKYTITEYHYSFQFAYFISEKMWVGSAGVPCPTLYI